MANDLKPRLTATERAMFHGKEGPAVQRAMEIIVALAKIYGAAQLVPVTSVQVAGVSYKNLGEAGLDFLRQWAAQGARARVSTTLNPAGMDMRIWRALGFPKEFAHQQQAVIDAYTAMGITPTCTCTPYLVGNQPSYGEHIAWAESSAVSFANSVLGARTNREGGPSALAAAICGRTAAYGLHLDENRFARYQIDVRCSLQTISDWGALGYLVGRQVRNGVPYFVLHDERSASPSTSASPSVSASPSTDTPLDDPMMDRLKSLGAAMAASGAVALYHIARLTPEARHIDIVAPEAQHISVEDLAAGYAALDGDEERIDLVSIGCPHASPREIRQIAHAVAGRKLQAALWVTTSRQTRERMAVDVATIVAAGGQVISDTCMVVAPVKELGFRSMATNSAKMAYYTPSHSNLSVHFGPLERCIEAAISSRW